MKDREIIEKVLEISGFKELNPVQNLALKKGLMKGNNLIIFSPTASGKTLIAELAAVKTILKKRKKVVYLVPLVALANEKYSEFKKKYEKLGIKVALSVGQYDSNDPWLARYDWIILSNEKFDSLIRHKAEWIEEIGLIIADEVHLINDIGRGPTLEVLLTLLKKILPKTQFLLLSATISNAKELGGWIGAKVVYSDWRPVKIYKGITFDSKMKIYEKGEIELREDLGIEVAVVDWVLKQRKQALIFVSTRRRAESLAEKISKFVERKIGKAERDLLKKLADEIENVLEIPTRQCKKEGEIVKRGVAFHHSGLLYKQRKLIEDNFRKGLIKVIVATPSLAYGVNLPSFLVGIKDVRRYYPGIGSVYLPVLEVEQMMGRSGRPTYDEYGVAVLFAKSEEEADLLTQQYIFGESEKIRSKLAVEPVLRIHALALIAAGFCNSEESLKTFFEKTFFAYQFGNVYLIEEKILDILDLFKEWKFVKERKGKLVATLIGRRISELYLDPLTAHKFLLGLENSEKRKVTELSFLHLISYTKEMRPLLSIRSGEFYEYNDLIEKRKSEILVEAPKEWEDEYEEFLKSFKTGLMFEAWINEATEEDLLEKFNVTPGELWSKLQIADWLLYSLQELALLSKRKELIKEIRKTRIRVQYGVKEELFPLVKLEGIGRVRARKLFRSGIKSISDLRKISLESLAKVIGPKIAKKIKNQVEGRKVIREKQKTLE